MSNSETLPQTETEPATAAPQKPVGGRNTAVLVGFTAVTSLADGVMKTALPFLAAQLTTSPTRITAVSMTLTLPWLLIALHIGVLVDRFDRRRLLWVANGMRMAIMGWLTLSALGDGLGLAQLFIGGAFLGIADVLASISASALVPAAIPETGRERANAWMLGAETVGFEFAGPSIGGLLLAAGTALALGAIGISYTVAALALLVLVGRFQAAGRAPGAAPASVGSRIVEGLRFIWQNRVLRTLMLVVAVLNATWGAWLALFPLYATQTLGLSPQRYGFALSALGIGGLTGTLVVAPLNRLLGRRWAMFAAPFGTTSLVALPALTTNLWAVTVGAFLGGMGGTLWTVNARTITQRLVPDEMLGRFSATFRFAAFGVLPLGAGLVGVLAELIDVRLAFGAFALVTTATLVPFFRNITPSALGSR